MYSKKDLERAKQFKSLKDMWEEEPPVRIAIAALLNSAYDHQTAYKMMAEHYNLTEAEYWRNVELYGLKELINGLEEGK
jgi:hypothetical protein